MPTAKKPTNGTRTPVGITKREAVVPQQVNICQMGGVETHRGRLHA